MNGVATDVDDAQTVADLVAQLGLVGKRIAVERNGEIVPRSRYAKTPVAPATGSRSSAPSAAADRIRRDEGRSPTRG